MWGLPSWAVRVIGIALLAGVVLAAGARIAAIWYKPQLAGMKAQITAASTQAKATAAAQRSITKAGAATEDQAQKTIVQQSRTIIERIPVYVSSDRGDARGCVTYGMLRLHDAAVLGIDPADLPPPAAQSDAACSPTSPADFMAAVAANYTAARQNAEQLDALEDDVRARIDAVGGQP